MGFRVLPWLFVTIGDSADVWFGVAVWTFGLPAEFSNTSLSDQIRLNVIVHMLSMKLSHALPNCSSHFGCSATRIILSVIIT